MSSFYGQFSQSGNIITANGTVTATTVDLVTVTGLGLTNFSASTKRLVCLSYAINAAGAVAAGTGTLSYLMDPNNTVVKIIGSADIQAGATGPLALSQTFLGGSAAPQRDIKAFGTSTGGSATTLDDSTAGFVAAGVAVGDIVIANSAFAVITARTATQLTFAGGWVGTAPAAVGALYSALPSFAKVRFTGTGAGVVWNVTAEFALISDGKFNSIAR